MLNKDYLSEYSNNFILLKIFIFIVKRIVWEEY